MSLLYMDGFEWNPQVLNENLQPALGFGKATQLNPGATRIAGRRAGSDAFELPAVSSAEGGYGKTLDANQLAIFMGVAFRAPAIGGNEVPIFWVRDTSTTIIFELVATYDGTLKIYRNGSQMAQTTRAIAAGVWNHIAWRLTNSTTAGIIEVRVNDVGWLSMAGQNTRPSGGGDFKSYGLGAPFTSRFYDAAHFDDFYILNASGTVNNTWIGDARVDTLRPTAAGAQAGLTATPAGSNWDRVNEVDTDLTDYVQSTASGQRDSYAYSDLPAMTTPSILGVQVNSIARKTDAGAASIRNLVRVGSTNYAQTAQPLLQLANAHLDMLERNPNGNVAWTESAVNAAEFGVESA